MTANCPACKRRYTCPSTYQHKQQTAAEPCPHEEKDPGSYWERGWV